MKINFKMNNIPKKYYNINQFSTNHGQHIRPVIERGASWSYNETKILLSLWGQDMVQRQLTNSKRTRHVWEKIAERIKQHGFDRTSDQVRTRVFNMIAEYRRILKNPTPERKKKCAFFDALHKIYQAKDTNGVRQALDNYEEEYHIDLIEFNNVDENEENLNDNEMIENSENSEDDKEVFSYAMSPSHFNSLHFKPNNFNDLSNSTNNMNNNSNSLNNSYNSNVDFPFNNIIHNSQQNSQNNSINGDHSDNHSDENIAMNENSNYFKQNKYSENNSYSILKKKKKKNFHFNDYSFLNRSNQNANQYSSQSTATVLIDKMFSHLAKGTEVMMEWVKLEQERLNQEMIKRREDLEREERREKKFLETLVKMQDQMFSFLSKQPSVNMSTMSNVRQLILESNSADENSENSSNFNSLNSNKNSDNSTESCRSQQPTSNIQSSIDTSDHNCLAQRHPDLKINKSEEIPEEELQYIIEEEIIDNEENYNFSNVQHEEIVD